MTTDLRLAIIRNDPNVGRGSCSHCDECWEDDEIIVALDEAGAVTPEEALDWAYEGEGLVREMGLNASSGEEACELRASHDEWETAMAAREYAKTAQRNADRFFDEEMSYADYHAEQRRLWDAVDSDGLGDEVRAIWRASNPYKVL